MAIRSDDITSILRSAIEGFDATVESRSVGTVVEVGDGIARIYGLEGALASELLEFPNGIRGMALNLEEETVGAVILGDYTSIKEGDTVKTTGSVVEVPVGAALIGRVVDPLGRPLDDAAVVGVDRPLAVDRLAEGVDHAPDQGVADRHRGDLAGRARGARRDHPQVGRHPGPDGHQGDRRADPDRARAARTDHR